MTVMGEIRKLYLRVRLRRLTISTLRRSIAWYGGIGGLWGDGDGERRDFTSMERILLLSQL